MGGVKTSLILISLALLACLIVIGHLRRIPDSDTAT